MRCPICKNTLTCPHCQASKGGKKGVKTRFAGKTKAEISEIMRKIGSIKKK